MQLIEAFTCDLHVEVWASESECFYSHSVHIENADWLMLYICVMIAGMPRMDGKP